MAGADGNRRQSRTLAFLSIDSMKTEIVHVIAKMNTRNFVRRRNVIDISAHRLAGTI
jgi:hypothetical protein